MNKYIAFYKGKQIVVEAHTSHGAQQIAASSVAFKAKRAWQVRVVLAERADGWQVVSR